MRGYLRTLRAEHGLTMQDAAARLGITKQYWEMIENGKRQRKMDIEMAAKIASLFGVSLQFVVDQENALLLQSEGATA